MSLPKLGAGSEGIILRGRKRKLRGGFCFSDPTDLRTSLLFCSQPRFVPVKPVVHTFPYESREK